MAILCSLSTIVVRDAFLHHKKALNTNVHRTIMQLNISLCQSYSLLAYILVIFAFTQEQKAVHLCMNTGFPKRNTSFHFQCQKLWQL